MQIEQARAVISGGASGLGLAVARCVISAGGDVLLLDVDGDKGRAAAEELGSRARFQAVDVTSEEQVQAAVAGTKDAGGINLAVSCAGVLGAGRVLGREGAMPLEHFARTISINLVGTFNLAKACAAAMQGNEANADGERGVIINTASIAAFEGQIGQAAYSASKGGVVGMTLPMAREFTRFGVRVVTIAPGVFHTPMVDIMPPEVQESLGASVPFPSRLGKPAEFADLAAHVFQNAYINGTTLRLDGAIRLQPK